ncbi:hypothetical protein ACFWWC_29105 [Streptomyces sp. NPDC058642]|uniref:hypothetical protein n=1 Tax=Streptomyces sp. NPDC058642 TaxID=3346572 RepID=UPI00366231F5
MGPFDPDSVGVLKIERGKELLETLPGLARRNLVVATVAFTLTDRYGARVMFILVSALTMGGESNYPSRC